MSETASSRANPYLGTQNDRQVLVQAPDAMIFINEEHQIPVCFECEAKVPIKRYVTQVSTSLSLEGSGGGNSSFDLVVPRHENLSFFRNGKCILAPMMEVEVWFKGAYTVYGMPRYYHAFWGYITSVTNDYSDGNHHISVSCNDMLSYWNIIKFSMSPGYLSSGVTAGRNWTVWQSVLSNLSPFEVLMHLALVSRNDLAEFRNINFEALSGYEAEELWRQSTDQMIRYWHRRLNKIARALRIYGTTGESIFNGASFFTGDLTERRRQLAEMQHATPQRLFGVDLTTNQDHFNPWQAFIGGAEAMESDHRGRLDIMVQVKDNIGWEFYLDTNGEIVFKPPFYNIDVRQNFPVSWIRDIEVISWNFDEAEPEATRADVFGDPFEKIQATMADLVQPIEGTFQDHNLVRQYGVRQENIQAHWLRDGRACNLYAADLVSTWAADRYGGNITIPGRPELRLGYPLYLESLDSFYYMTSILHSFAPGSSFTTSISLKGKRSRFGSTDLIQRDGITLPDGTTLNIDVNGINRDKDGRDVGIPNVVMRPATLQEFQELFDQGDPMVIGAPNPDGDTLNPDRAGDYTPEVASSHSRKLSQDDYMLGRSLNNLEQTWVYDLDQALGVSSYRMELQDLSTSAFEAHFHDGDFSEAVMPVSDDAGFQLIGVFPYGRGLFIDSKGAIVSPTGDLDEDEFPSAVVGSATDNAVASTVLRDMTPDDQVEVTVGTQTRETMGGGALSGQRVLRVDQTNQGTTFANMAPTDGSTVCTCKDNYTIDNLLLEGLTESLGDVFERITSVDQLLSDSYQVSSNEVYDHEVDHLRTQIGGDVSAVADVTDLGSGVPISPSVDGSGETR